MPGDPVSDPGRGPGLAGGSEPGAVPEGWHRPKTQRYTMLSVLWVFPSLGALVILGLGVPGWREADSLGGLVAATRFEHWLALVLLGLHPVFFWLARHYRNVETPVPLPPEPDEDGEGDEGDEGSGGVSGSAR